MSGTLPHSATDLCYLSAHQVARLLGIHIKTFYRKFREGKLVGFPEPLIFGTDLRRWVASEVDAWMRSRPRQQRRPTHAGRNHSTRRLWAESSVSAAGRTGSRLAEERRLAAQGALPGPREGRLDLHVGLGGV